jgi:hypothetical protein
MNGNLSSVQFGQMHPLTEFKPAKHGLQTGQMHPRYNQDYEQPLALSSGINNSASTAAAWRKPTNHVLPYSAATAGSVFKPFG